MFFILGGGIGIRLNNQVRLYDMYVVKSVIREQIKQRCRRWMAEGQNPPYRYISNGINSRLEYKEVQVKRT